MTATIYWTKQLRMMLRLQSGLEFYVVQDASELEQLIRRLVSPNGTGAFWLHESDEAKFALFLNGDWAVVHSVPHAAWSSNPSGAEEEFERFVLENGEGHEFPLSECVSPGDGISAFLDLAIAGACSPRISWR